MEDNIGILKNIVLFQDFQKDEDILKKIDRLFTARKAKKGDVVIKEGEEGDELFIIKSGSVRILKNTLQDEPYTVVILNAAQNIFFGEIGLLLNDRRTATVIAEEDSTFLVTTKDKFKEFGEKESYIAMKITRQIAQILARRLHKTNDDVVTLFSALVSEVESSTSLE